MKLYRLSFIALIFCLGFYSCSEESKESKLLSLLDSISKDKYFSTDQFSEINLDEIYGAWNFDSSSGGFSGGGYGTDFNYLLIKPNSIFGIVLGNELIETGKIEIISDPGEDVEIRFFPEIDSNEVNLTGDTKRVTIEGNQLSLISGCCDRYSEFFTREE